VSDETLPTVNLSEWRVRLFTLIGEYADRCSEDNEQEADKVLNKIDSHVRLLRRMPPPTQAVAIAERLTRELLPLRRCPDHATFDGQCEACAWHDEKVSEVLAALRRTAPAEPQPTAPEPAEMTPEMASLVDYTEAAKADLRERIAALEAALQERDRLLRTVARELPLPPRMLDEIDAALGGDDEGQDGNPPAADPGNERDLAREYAGDPLPWPAPRAMPDQPPAKRGPSDAAMAEARELLCDSKCVVVGQNRYHAQLCHAFDAGAVERVAARLDELRAERDEARNLLKWRLTMTDEEWREQEQSPPASEERRQAFLKKYGIEERNDE